MAVVWRRVVAKESGLASIWRWLSRCERAHATATTSEEGQLEVGRRLDRIEKLSVTLGATAALRQFDQQLLSSETSDSTTPREISTPDHSLTPLLLLCARSGDYVLATHILERMIQKNEKVGCVARGSVIKAFCKARKLTEALEFMVQLPWTDVSQRMYSTLLSACASSPELFEKAWEDMESKGVVPDEQIWVHRLRVKASISLDELQHDWKEYIADSESLRGFRTQTAYVVGLAGGGDGQGAWRMMRDLIRSHPLEQDTPKDSQIHRHHSIGWNALLGYCLRHRNYEMCKEMISAMEASGFHKTIFVFNHILANMSMAQRSMTEMEELLQEMQSKGVMPNQNTYQWLLGASRKQNRLSDLQRHWQKMLELGILPNTACFNEMLMGCAMTGDFVKGEQIFQSMCQSSCRPDSYTFLTLFTTTARFIMTEKAAAKREWVQSTSGSPYSWAALHTTVRNWEDQMTRQYRIKFCGAVLTKLLQVYGLMSSATDISRVLETAQKQKCRPDLSAYNTAIYSFSALGKADLSFALFQQMGQDGIAPSVRTYNALLLLYTKRSKPSIPVWELLSRMAAQGIEVNDNTFRTLLHGCHSEGDLRRLVRYIHRSPSRPSHLTWQRLVKKHLTLKCTASLPLVSPSVFLERAAALALGAGSND